jgi:large subunit ribosomal protein L9
MDIAAALNSKGFDAVQKSQVRLPDGPLKAVGEYPVLVALHADVVSNINVVIQGEMA